MDAEVGPLNEAKLLQIANHLGHYGRRNGERIARVGSGLRGNGRVDANQFAGQVDQRTSAVARIDSRVRLNETFDGIHLSRRIGSEESNVSTLGADNSGRNSGGEVQRVAHREHPFTHANVIRVPQGEGVELRGGVDLQDGEVRAGVAAQQLRLIGRPVGQIHANFPRSLDDVMVRDNEAILLQNHPTA